MTTIVSFTFSVHAAPNVCHLNYFHFFDNLNGMLSQVNGLITANAFLHSIEIDKFNLEETIVFGALVKPGHFFFKWCQHAH